MRLHRFYTTQPLGEEIVKIGDQNIINQLLNVFRFKEGQEVILFSQDNYDYHYLIDSYTKKEITFKLKSKELSIVPQKKVTLYMSLVKKDTFETVVRTCTELGVTQIVPVMSERCEKKNLNEERLKIISIEASEQCGRTNIPIISPIISLKEAIEAQIVAEQTQNNAEGTQTRNIVASLFGEKINSEDVKKVISSPVLNIFVGPEGGFTDNEEKMFDESCFTKIKLTDTILKADTGAQAIVVLAMILG